MSINYTLESSIGAVEYNISQAKRSLHEGDRTAYRRAMLDVARMAIHGAMESDDHSIPFHPELAEVSNG